MSLAATDSTQPLQRLVCARCGTSFECGANAGACWCMDEAYRLPMPDTADTTCLCPSCLRVAATTQSAGLSA